MSRINWPTMPSCYGIRRQLAAQGLFGCCPRLHTIDLVSCGLTGASDAARGHPRWRLPDLSIQAEDDEFGVAAKKGQVVCGVDTRQTLAAIDQVG
jgi:hypothetical protein